MSTAEYIIEMWLQSYEGIYTLIIGNGLIWIGWVLKDGVINKEHLK
jgi:hypothetical protein